MLGSRKSVKSSLSLLCHMCKRRCHGETQTEPATFMSLVKLHRKMLNDKEALIKYLISNVIYEDDRIIALNKPMELPLSYHPPKTYQGSPIPLHDQPVNLEALLPRLRAHFGEKELNLSMPLQRLYSGVIVLGKTIEDCKRYKTKSEGMRKHRHMFQQMDLICIGVPQYLPSKPEDVFLKFEKINDVPQSVIVSSASNNQRRFRKDVDFHCCFPEVVTQYREGKSVIKAWCHVKLSSISSAMDVSQNYMAKKLAPVLGDQIYHKNVNFLLGQTVPCDPRLNPQKEMPIHPALLDRLNMTKEEISLIPVMAHKSLISVRNFHSSPIVAPLPDYFHLALEKLKLLQSDNNSDSLQLSSSGD